MYPSVSQGPITIEIANFNLNTPKCPVNNQIQCIILDVAMEPVCHVLRALGSTVVVSVTCIVMALSRVAISKDIRPNFVLIQPRARFYRAERRQWSPSRAAVANQNCRGPFFRRFGGAILGGRTRGPPLFALRMTRRASPWNVRSST